MNVAIATLNDEGVTIAALADRLGYESKAAFARAFKRVTGQWPSEAHQRARSQTAFPRLASACVLLRESMAI